ncbi:hypothetical protein CFP65_0927 [Kitasatospora sp. MMS16-BH015]|uniref:hypothetical protein n=1 Tax=Kitasatospora sp. MMS16-BH015 TaxID=2018025 RepID=UPI000CA0ECC1|nr:hypothetical protein [Kitasatospora sp. MMS16-BH015]AUG75848.1 hypothetical protein CFP65_0927 [Kitasatospora sp. MMS16-BH015]
MSVYRRRAGLVVLMGLVAGGVADCGPNTDAYVALQNAMKTHLTDVDHRPVASVACTPHVHDTTRGDSAHLRCTVVFQDGSSYTAGATIKNQNDGGRHNMPDLYSWDAPPAP